MKVVRSAVEEQVVENTEPAATGGEDVQMVDAPAAQLLEGSQGLGVKRTSEARATPEKEPAGASNQDERPQVVHGATLQQPQRSQQQQHAAQHADSAADLPMADAPAAAPVAPLQHSAGQPPELARAAQGGPHARGDSEAAPLYAALPWVLSGASLGGSPSPPPAMPDTALVANRRPAAASPLPDQAAPAAAAVAVSSAFGAPVEEPARQALLLPRSKAEQKRQRQLAAAARSREQEQQQQLQQQRPLQRPSWEDWLQAPPGQLGEMGGGPARAPAFNVGLQHGGRRAGQGEGLHGRGGRRGGQVRRGSRGGRRGGRRGDSVGF